MDSTSQRFVADHDWSGLWRLVFRSDPAILARQSMPTGDVVLEERPVDEHQSNGVIEVSVREIQKQIRVMKSALDERLIDCSRRSLPSPETRPWRSWLCTQDDSCQGVTLVVRGAQLANCMLVSRTALVEFCDRCALCVFVLGAHD